MHACAKLLTDGFAGIKLIFLHFRDKCCAGLETSGISFSNLINCKVPKDL